MLGTCLTLNKLQIIRTQASQAHGRRVAVVFDQLHLAINELDEPSLASEIARVIDPLAHFIAGQAAGFTQHVR